MSPNGTRANGGRPLLVPLARNALNFLLIAAAVAVVGWLIGELQLVIVPVLLSLLIATLLVPPADALRRRGVPSILATFLVMLGGLGILAGILTLIVPAVVSEIGAVGPAAENGLDSVTDWLVGGPLDLSQAEVDEAIDNSLDQIRDNAGVISTGLVTGAGILGQIVVGVLLAAVIVFFLVHDGRRMWSFLVGLLSEERRETVDAAGHRMWTTLSAYLKGVLVIAFVDAVLIGIALALIGVPLVIPLAALVFLGAFIPLVGATVSGTVAALVALADGGIWPALLVVAVIILIQQLEGDLIYPVLVGKAVSLHPLAILLVLTAGTIVAGIFGALLAVPVAAAGWAAIRPLREDVDTDEQGTARTSGAVP